eukprot:TRINITY_DN399_c0_g1_i3.p2 TRINITY_DN399_c0_g1~~TRINITY_DN399_c0_g1_i3.p2  ORF type:complete len:150 (+),score=61.35 TRINITY_DN399_c0_g1_i3:3-452(+)
MMYIVFFFNDTATTEIYTEQIVGSVRCVQETDIYIQTYLIRMEVENKVLTIITNDGKKFDVDGRIQKLSGLIQTTLQDTQETEIPIPDVDGDVFQKVVEYCQLHDYNPRHYKKPIVTKELSEILDTKDLKFLEPYNICLLYTSPSPRDS